MPVAPGPKNPKPMGSNPGFSFQVNPPTVYHAPAPAADRPAMGVPTQAPPVADHPNYFGSQAPVHGSPNGGGPLEPPISAYDPQETE